MAKQTGLGDNLYVGGYDLSGDVQMLGAIGGGPEALDFTDITQSAFDREGGLRSGRIEWTSYFNPAAARAHEVLGALPNADVLVTYLRGQALGGAGACLIGKQIDYAPTRAADGQFTFSLSAPSNSFGLEWGEQLTTGAGGQTVTGATSTTGVDFGASTSFGLQAYLQVLAFTGTDATIRLQESSDNGSGDAYANVTDGAFAQVTTAHVAERIATSAAQTVERWLRVNIATSGGFSSLTFSVVVVKNTTAVVF